MNMRTVIVEDNPKTIKVLAKLLSENFKDVEIVGFCTSVKEGIEMISSVKPDLLFLDIEMPEQSGFDLLEQIGDKNFEVIFHTGFDHYAIKAIRFSALDYLLKPVEIQELEKAVQRARERIKAKKPDQRISNFLRNFNALDHEQKLALPTAYGYDYIELKRIIRCESESNYTYFFLVGGSKILVSRPLKEYDELLSPHNFFRVHNSHLVNLHHVSKYLKGSGGQVVMNDGTTVDVSQRKKEAFLETLRQL